MQQLLPMTYHPGVGGGGEGGGIQRMRFPERLHELLDYSDSIDDDDDDDHGGVGISWIDDGRAIQIGDPGKLTRILPLFFPYTKLRSFMRQMDMWSFGQIVAGPHQGSWFHPYFRRDHRDWCAMMNRNNKITTGIIMSIEDKDPDDDLRNEETNSTTSPHEIVDLTEDTTSNPGSVVVAHETIADPLPLPPGMDRVISQDIDESNTNQEKQSAGFELTATDNNRRRDGELDDIRNMEETEEEGSLSSFAGRNFYTVDIMKSKPKRISRTPSELEFPTVFCSDSVGIVAIDFLEQDIHDYKLHRIEQLKRRSQMSRST